MKEIKPLGIEHLSEWFGNPRNGAGFMSLGWAGIQTVVLNAAYQLMGIFKKDNQLRYGLMVNSTGNAAHGLVQIPLRTLWGNRGDIASAVIGFRYKPGNRSGPAIFGVKLDITASDGSAVPDNIIYTIPAGSPEGYYELRITPYDHPDRGYRVYRDGELIATPAFGAWLTMATFANRCCFTIGTASPTIFSAASGYPQGDYAFSMEDIYLAWSNVPGESVLQGPIRVKRLPYAEVTPANWTVQGGKTPLAVLNLAPNSGAERTDYLVSDLANTTLKAKLDVSVLKSTDQVLAVAASTSAWRDGGTTGNLACKWSHTDGVGPVTSYSPTAGAYNTQFDVPLELLTTTPGGAALTKASLAALELVVTPSP